MHRVLVIGAGSIGNRHIRCFLATERASVGFVEIDDALRQQVAERYPTVDAYLTLEQGLDAKPTAAVIATPAPLHIEQANLLAARGVHLLIEKPLSLSVVGVDKLIAIVQRQKLTAAVGYVYRAHPLLAKMHEILQSNRFGKPVELIAVCGQHFPHYRPAYRQTYFARREAGGGAVQDALTHVFDLSQWLVGPIERLVADLDHKVLEGVAVEDTVHVLARHDGGVMSSFALNQHQAPDEFTVTVVCEQGTVRFELHHKRLRTMTHPGGTWSDSEMNVETDMMFVRQAHIFLDAVEGRQAPLCSLREGLSVMRANIAALSSAESGSWSKIGHLQ